MHVGLCCGQFSCMTGLENGFDTEADVWNW